MQCKVRIMSVTFLGPLSAAGEKLSLVSFQIPAGFPSPATDHLEKYISLDELFDVRAPHVYIARIEGDSMQGAGIYCGDFVIVDRSVYAEHGDIVIAAINSEPVCKRLHMRENELILISENSKYPPRQVKNGDELTIWGVVRHSVRNHAKA